LARAFGFSATFWLGLQSDYDIEVAQQAAEKELRKIKPYTAKAA